MSEALAAARSHFAKVFGEGGKLRVIRAPGRVNLIGEHVDYNDGFVLPMAIDRHVYSICRARDDSKIRLASTAYADHPIEIDLSKKIERAEPQWANYSRGVAAELIEAGIPLVGADILLHNTLPVGGGLSSSAAVLVATALSLLTLGGSKMEPDAIAALCRQAERKYAGVPCGIMDQTAVAAGRVGHAMLLDCRDRSKHFVPIDPMEARIVIANTMVHHELSDGAYAERVKSCEQAVAAIAKTVPGAKSLRDVTEAQVVAARLHMDDTTFRRARHVVSEIARTVLAAEQLSRRRYEDVGELMHQSHESLRLDYEVSCDELNFMAAEAGTFKGVYGSRMTGGGFGGCIVALVQPRAVEGLIAHLESAYKQKYNIQPTVFATTAAPGASVLE